MTASIRLDPSACPVPEAMTAATKPYADPTGAFSAGVWRSKPNRIEVRYTKDEFCLLLEGEVHLTDAAGRTEIYRPGDAFVVPAGFVGTWDMPVPVTKYYVLHAPKV
ncbi:MAG TPA: cupin domain-containing protein [Beijerinckiaceae bacterium]|jgi:uncharacterized cupin superfamily protein